MVTERNDSCPRRSQKDLVLALDRPRQELQVPLVESSCIEPLHRTVLPDRDPLLFQDLELKRRELRS